MTNTRILIVEDESIVALDISNRLIKMGYKVLAIAASGHEAIQKAQELSPDLILMDIKLKGEMDGVEAVREIQVKLDIPAIYLTAYADEATLQRAKITGPYGYLLKPFEERELHTTIEMALYKHKLERQLKESEQWLSTTLKSIGDAVIATDAQERVKFMNPAAERLTGWQVNQAIGKNAAAVFRIINEHTRTPIDRPVMEILQTGQAINLSDHLLIAKDGTEIPIDDNVAPILDKQNNIIGIVLTFQDITDKRATQARLVKQERLAAVGRLAGGIAHEFNNILTSIIGFAQLARSSLNNQAPISRDLDQVIEQGQRAAHLVRQILDFGERSMLQKRSLELTPFLKETCKLLKHTLPKNIDLALTIEPECDTCTVAADPTLIQQALTNLISNAVDAMPTGGTVQIQVSCLILQPGESLPSQIILDNDRPDNQLHWIALSVSDTGLGIAPEHRPHIFEPFFSTKEVGQGSGLGLSQVYGIVKQHNGNIEITSHIGQGTTVVLYLPVSPVPREAVQADIEVAGIPRGHGELLLLVEGEPETGNVTQAILEHLDYQVLTANNREEAVETYTAHLDEIALVIIDTVAPGVEGLTTTTIQTLQEKNPTVKLIALTNYQPEVVSKAQPGYDKVNWLQKPWNLEDLAQAVNLVLQK
jgi:hypothetical protein